MDRILLDIGENIMEYIKGFKHQLNEEYVSYTGIVGYEAETTWIRLEEDVD